MPIALPEKPDGHQYEDFVAACLRVLGYFTETRTVLRDGGKEVLELDIVATPTGDIAAAPELFEAKAGKDGISFTNVFKLYGQSMYLKIPSACIASLETVHESQWPIYESRAKEMGVRLVHLLPSAEQSVKLAEAQNALTDEERNKVVEVAWFQHIAKRLALAEFNKVAAPKNAPPAVCEKAKAYLFGVYGAFFEPTPLDRSEGLYHAFKETPLLPGEAVSFLATQAGVTPSAIWNRVNGSQEHLWVQMIMHLEWTARLRIIKNALDDFLLRGPMPLPTGTLKFGDNTYEFPAHALPASFKEGLKALHSHPHALRIPYLLQVFAELLGGWLVYNDKDELAFVERLTGVPANEIVPALQLLDKFFPMNTGKSWLYDQASELLVLKMTPGYVRGGGAFLRSALFNLDSYQSKYAMAPYIGMWHNSLYHVLESELKKAQTVGV